MTIDNWETFTANAWGWKWLEGIWVQHPGIRPSDLDGFVHVEGQLMLLDGKTGAGFPMPSYARKRMVYKAGNVTCLYLRAAGLNPDDHEPRDITHYYLMPGPWPAQSWQWDSWTTTSLDQIRLMCVQWATWADMRHRFEEGAAS